jgi:flagellar hook-associated protein 1
MIGLLSTLNLAQQSLETQMTEVQVAGQNLSNVNTPGYTRQTVDVEATPDVEVPGVGLEGTGAQVVAIQQAVNTLLNNQVQGQQSVNGYWNEQQSALQTVQSSLDEFLSTTNSASSTTGTGTTTSSGLSTLMNNFFNDLQSVATSPTSVAARQTLISDAQNLSSAFNQIDAGLTQQKSSLNTALGNDVNSANQLLSGIASLNQQISAAEFGGGNANDLIDEQQEDLSNLAQLTNITTTAGANGVVNVSVDGQTLVSGFQVQNTLQTYDPGNGGLLVETSGGAPLTLTGGSMQGEIDARDGTLATLQSNINTLASMLITQFNSIYTSGYSLTGSTGGTFFTGAGSSTIAVNSSVIDDPSSFQASGSATASGDNSIALQLADLANAPQAGALGGQTFSGSFADTVGNFGDALQTANTQVSNQTAVLNMLTTQQSSVSGVSIDEEMTHLLNYQQVYEASAELVTTINQMLGDSMSMMSGG